MNICLVGGSGFVGTRLIELLDGDFNIKNIDKNPSVFYSQYTHIADVRDKDALIAHFENQDIIVLLSAEHRDDVSPISLYYDVNVQGTKNVLDAMDVVGINKIIFISSVAVYGLNKRNPNEDSPVDPFNHYGKSKWQAEEFLRKWYLEQSQNRSLSIIRPTVIFGERNRGNVYNLLRQIASGHFLMVGNGKNIKSMAYVGNVVAFIKYCIIQKKIGYELYNYIDKPDYTMNDLVACIERTLQKHTPSVHIPYYLGMMGGYCFDILAKLFHRKLSVSSVRVRKFCATTEFSSQKIFHTNFKVPYTLDEGLEKTLHYEFVMPKHDKDQIIFETE